MSSRPRYSMQGMAAAMRMSGASLCLLVEGVWDEFLYKQIVGQHCSTQGLSLRFYYSHEFDSAHGRGRPACDTFYEYIKKEGKLLTKYGHHVVSIAVLVDGDFCRFLGKGCEENYFVLPFYSIENAALATVCDMGRVLSVLMVHDDPQLYRRKFDEWLSEFFDLIKPWLAVCIACVILDYRGLRFGGAARPAVLSADCVVVDMDLVQSEIDRLESECGKEAWAKAHGNALMILQNLSSYHEAAPGKWVVTMLLSRAKSYIQENYVGLHSNVSRAVLHSLIFEECKRGVCELWDPWLEQFELLVESLISLRASLDH